VNVFSNNLARDPAGFASRDLKVHLQAKESADFCLSPIRPAIPACPDRDGRDRKLTAGNRSEAKATQRCDLTVSECEKAVCLQVAAEEQLLQSCVTPIAPRTWRQKHGRGLPVSVGSQQ
jgi:hypothetical protein